MHRSSLSLRLSLGMGIAALTVVPVVIIGLVQFNRIHHKVETLIYSHARQESFGHRFLVATAGARRASRSFALLGDNLVAARAREYVSIATSIAESLRVAGEDSLASAGVVVAGVFSATLDSLVVMSPNYAANVAHLQDHARAALDARRTRLDHLLRAAAETDLGVRDSLMAEAEAGFQTLDLDSLLLRMPATETQTWRLDARLDSLSRAMTAIGESVVDRARSGMEEDATALAVLVSRGERNLLGVLLATTVLAATWVVYFPRTLQNPLKRLVGLVRRAAEGDFDFEMPGCRYQELQDLSEALNDLVACMAQTDRLRSEKVRLHWRRLQLLARDSLELWCIADGGGTPVLMSAPLANRVDPGACDLPPAGFSVARRHQVDPTDPGMGAVLWLMATDEDKSKDSGKQRRPEKR
ncbi:methyl-accepting chemotaxis protein [Candidatus Fermentibacteria bacterium]|nr:methyl-accepting chemotaxis protein [Candidatus Fermentibacteria bacterium]